MVMNVMRLFSTVFYIVAFFLMGAAIYWFGSYAIILPAVQQYKLLGTIYASPSALIYLWESGVPLDGAAYEWEYRITGAAYRELTRGRVCTWRLLPKRRAEPAENSYCEVAGYKIGGSRLTRQGSAHVQKGEPVLKIRYAWYGNS